MKIDGVSRLLPFSCEQVFDLVADIERYPEFVPAWISARIVKRETDTLYAEQVLGVGPARVQFCTTAVLRRAERIDVSSSESPFRRYSLRWLIAPGPASSCSLRVTADMELQSRILQQVMDCVLPTSIKDVIDAFEARATSLYLRRDR